MNRRLAAAVATAAVSASVVAAVGALLAVRAFGRPIMEAATANGVQIAAMILWWLLRYRTLHFAWRGGSFPRALRVEAVLCALVSLGGLLPIGGGRWGVGAIFTLFAAGVLVVDLARTFARNVLDPAAGPWRVSVLSVAAWIVIWSIGTVLLALPASTHPAVPDFTHNFWRHIHACMFMSAGATSLCGATIYSPGEDLRFFGQAVLYVLMQAGGWLFLVIGLASLRPWLARPIRLRTIGWVWAGLQLAAIAWSHPHWRPASGGEPAPEWWPAVFHAASAINHCGFVLRQEGLASYLSNGPIFWSMLALSVLGGAGLVIAWDRITAVVEAVRSRRQAARRTTQLPLPSLLPDLCSIELHTTIWVLCIAAGLFWLCESPGLVPAPLTSSRPVYLEVHQTTLADMGPGDRWRAALLLSAGARSTGLNVAPLSQGAITWPTWALLIGLMTLGGAIGSAAGGIRTGTAAMLLHAGRFRRAGLDRATRIAAGVVIAIVLLNLAAVGLLHLCQPEWSAWDVVLHVASLVNGVGWSTGLTPHLTDAGRVGMIVLMFCGRMAPSLGWVWIAARMPAAGARPARPCALQA